MSIIITSIENLPEALKLLTDDLDNGKSCNVDTKKSMSMNETKEKSLNAAEGTIEATPEIAAIVDDLNKVEQLKGKLLSTEENLKLKIMDYMQFNSKLSFNDKYLVSWKSINRTSFDLKAFKTAFPDMYEMYLKNLTRIFKLY